jgi:beta-mannosidase
MNPTTTTRQLHEGWTFREQDAAPIPHSDVTGWLPAEVPGHVHLDLQRAGVIPDPFERMHERGVQWVDERDWTYRCTFEVAAAELDGARHVVRFGGLDTIATVLLNGTVVSQTDNQFVPVEIDVTGALVPATNRLEVRFASAERIGAARREAALADLDPAYAGSAGFTTKSLVRKAQYSWGWDWGPCLRGCGIWQPVHLVRIPVARIGDWSWRATFAADGSCRVAVAVDVEPETLPADLGVRVSLD